MVWPARDVFTLRQNPGQLGPAHPILLCWAKHGLAPFDWFTLQFIASHTVLYLGRRQYEWSVISCVIIAILLIIMTNDYATSMCIFKMAESLFGSL